MLEYKGYTVRVELDVEAGIFHGEVLDLKDVITFQGKSVEELEVAFRDSIDDYLEFCADFHRKLFRPVLSEVVATEISGVPLARSIKRSDGYRKSSRRRTKCFCWQSGIKKRRY